MAKLDTKEKDFKKGVGGDIYKPSTKDKERIKFLQDRFKQIEEAEKKKDLRAKLEKWNAIYVPHQFNKIGLKKWQSKSAKNLAFTKIQTAVAVVVEQNPGFQFFQRTDQDKPLIPLWKSLLDYIGDVGRSFVQLKKFFFNLFKDGTAVGQVYWKYETREVQVEKSYDLEKDEAKYETKTIEDFNNPYWAVLERKDVYIDETAKTWDPKGEHPVRDWFKRIVYDKDAFENRFPETKYPNVKYCKPGGELADEGTDKVMLTTGKEQYEALFYENKPKDGFSILCNGVLLRDRPLPYKHKQLSIFGCKLFERPDDIDGIGFPEAIENDEAMLDTLSNTRLDQIILDIYKVLKVGFGEELEDYELELEPNKILRLRDPAVASWMESSKVGSEAFQEEAVIKSDIDEKTGVSKELLGGMAQRRQTATETAINREAGLRRLKTPLENVEDAMEIKERLMIGMVKQIYSVPAKKELDEGGMEILGYRKVRLPIEMEKGEFMPSTTQAVFEIRPEYLMNEPDIKIRHMSMMPISKAMVRQDVMSFYSLIGSHPYTDTFKAYNKICEAWEQDVEDWRMSEEQIAQQQQQATMGGQMLGTEGAEKSPVEGGGATRTTVPTEAGGTTEVPVGQGKQGIFKRAFQKITGRMT